MSEIVQFPSNDRPQLLFGPFETWSVIVSGREIPRLTGRRTEDGRINLIVDGRFMGGPFSEEDAEQAAHLIAQALAIGAGYSNLEADAPGRPFAHIITHLGEMPEKDVP